MTTAERKLLHRNLVLGVAVTLVVVALDAIHGLVGAENLFYNWRVRHCQHFAPKPTPAIVHVDIDDPALESIGAWPWPRQRVARIVDEIRRAGAAAIALDILYSERRKSGEGESTKEDLEGDAMLAGALAASGRAIVPVTFTFGRPAAQTSGPRQRMAALLAGNLELTFDQCTKRLHDQGAECGNDDDYQAALHEAAAQQVAAAARSAGPGGALPPLDQLRDRLLPTLRVYTSSAPSRVLEAEYDRFEALRALRRHTLPVPAGLPPLLRASNETAPLPQLSDAACSVGFVDFLPGDDGVVRLIPLAVEDRGRLVPQLGLALACAYLGIDVGSLQVSKDRIVIPRPGAAPILIPMTVGPSSTTAEGKAGLLMDVPLLGTKNALTMYDYPRFREVVQHVPIYTVSQVVTAADRVRGYNQASRQALIDFWDVADPAKGKAIRAAPLNLDDAEGQKKLVDAAVEFMSSDAVFDLQSKLSEADRRRFTVASVALDLVQKQNQQVAAELAELRATLRDTLGGKAVIIGSTATALGDFTPTSLHPRCPGVVVHGAVFNAILNQWFWPRAPQWVTILLTVVVGLLATAACAWLPPVRALASMLGLVAVYVAVNGVVVFDWGHWILGMAGPVLAAGGVWSGVTFTRFIVEGAERRRITRRFSSYVDPNLVNYLLDHPELDYLKGEVQELTVVFTDLQGFTTLTERLREEAVPILSDYLGRMVPVIQNHRGLVNKFLGDGIMFFYNAPARNPDHAADAVKTVLEMYHVLKKFNEDLTARGAPNVNMRAGVSTGPMVVGDTGPKSRSEYTVLGDAVNLAARLESANKAVGTLKLISGRTAELLGDQFILRPVGKLVVAGKTEGIMTYEPLGPASEATDEHRRRVELSRAVVDAYEAARFTDCLAAVDEYEKAFGEGKWSELLREWCDHYLAEPPTDFAGSIKLKEK